MSTPLLPQSRLENLAPANLPQRSKVRYDGGGISVEINSFTPADAERLRLIYHDLMELAAMLGAAIDDEPLPAQIEMLKERKEWVEIFETTRVLGRAESYTELQNQILHDIRGGSLLVLLATVDLVSPHAYSPAILKRLFYFARDHLKIMRNGVPDLDPGRYIKDHEMNPHSFHLLAEKWSGSRFPFESGLKKVIFNCAVEGITAVRCSEFSALDRILYNLINNSVRYSAGSEIGFSIFTPKDEVGGNVRFVIQNSVSKKHAKRLKELTEGNLGRLFLGGLTTAGSGLGMRNCADFVRLAYDLKSSAETVEKKYVGAQIIQDVFAVWFHWPKG